MRWFRNRTTTIKLLMAFGLMAVLVGFVGYEGVRAVNVLDQHIKDVRFHTGGVATVREAEGELLSISRGLSNGVIDGIAKDEAALDRRIQNGKRYDEAFRSTWARFREGLILPEMRTLTAEILADYDVLRPKQEQVLALVKAGRMPEAEAALKDARKAQDALEAKMARAIEIKTGLAQRIAEDASAAARSAFLVVVVFMIGAVAVAVVAGVVIARMNARPLGDAVQVLESVAGGDLTKRLDVDTEDEVGRLAAALNQAVDGMRTALGEVTMTATHAVTASQQLSAAAEQLASGAQEQASSIEETAASLEEITGTVRQNADNARQANQLAVRSRDAADKGGHVVATAIEAMAAINESSKKIADIITAIDEIAFQTNLLALNAAVEAARAGEQGRGFAVVAAEVRNLAQRSATAAKEIKALIEDSVGKVEAGSELVNQSGQTLGEIVTSVKRVTDLIAEIAAASQEQATGIDQVNKAVTQMDQVVQSNSAQTEELSSTAQGLAAQAEELETLVARFKLGGGPAPDAGVARASATFAIPAKPVVRRRVVHQAAAPARHAELSVAAAHVTNGAAHGDDDGFEQF